MTPFHFGPPERSLFAILHGRERAGPSRGGVLLAAPFGHEAIRTHRLYRVLADRLARKGHDVLRFDYFGTGDSAGDDADVRLSGWAADILSAHRELGERTGEEPAWWVGARLGATAMMQARELLPGRSVASVPALVLWAPIVDGAAYLEELRVKHVEALEASFSVSDPRWRKRLRDPDVYADEAIGFAIPSGFRAEVLAIRASELSLVQTADLAVVGGPTVTVADTWAQGLSPAITPHRLERDFEWTSDDSLNTALVPNDAMRTLLEIIDGPRG